MSGFATFLLVLLVIDALFLILLIVALQQGSEGGSIFGAANTSGFFGASGGVNWIRNATWVSGVILFTLSLTLSKINTEIDKRQHSLGTEEILKIIPQETNVNAPVAPEAVSSEAVSSEAVSSEAVSPEAATSASSVSAP